MKRLLLTGCIAATALTGAATTPVTYYGEEMGSLNGVSDNGRYAVVCDEDNGIAYLWCIDEPDLFADISEAQGGENIPSGQRVKGTHVYDVSDTGMAVGSIGYADGHSVAAYFDLETQEWTALERPDNAQNSVEAVAVTPDGKVIAGYYVKANKALEFGQYHPCQWFLDDDGEYTLKTYEHIELPFHQGFFPMAQTPDGHIISGQVYGGVRSTMPALMVDGELVLFNEFTTTYEPLEYKGKYEGRDEEGNQIWLDDLDDPRIVWYVTELIDGCYDGQKWLDGYLAFCDGEGNFYGMRSWFETSVDDYGNEDVNVESAACIYNFHTNEFEYDPENVAFSCGVGEDLVFTADNEVLTANRQMTVNEAYGVNPPDGAISAGIAKMSLDGSVLGGIYAVFVEAIGDYYYFPYVVITDESGVQTTCGGGNVSVVLSRGHIDVLNATDAIIYDMDGRIAAKGVSADLTPGAYVVKAGEKSIKAIVR